MQADARLQVFDHPARDRPRLAGRVRRQHEALVGSDRIVRQLLVARRGGLQRVEKRHRSRGRAAERHHVDVTEFRQEMRRSVAQNRGRLLQQVLGVVEVLGAGAKLGVEARDLVQRPATRRVEHLAAGTETAAAETAEGLAQGARVTRQVGDARERCPRLQRHLRSDVVGDGPR